MYSTGKNICTYRGGGGGNKIYIFQHQLRARRANQFLLLLLIFRVEERVTVRRVFDRTVVRDDAEGVDATIVERRVLRLYVLVGGGIFSLSGD